VKLSSHLVIGHQARAQALTEFQGAVAQLRSAGVRVVVAQGTDPDAPDAIFPNNWFSTHRAPGEGIRIVSVSPPLESYDFE
jgi:hypothetical protein